MIDFSFIVPTRNRPVELRRFLTSLKETTADPSRLEIVLGIDDDDVLSREIDEPALQIKRVSLTPGQRMGWMNNQCTAATTGRFVMIQNDDIVARTPGWDDIIRSYLPEFEDEIVLFHVNDMLFKERLCCFPLVSRTYINLMGEICSNDFKRYRIDDNIFDIFCLLAYMGERRIVYLPDVIFEHINFEEESGERKYMLNVPALEHDAALYAQRWAQRKADALKLYNFIQARKRTELDARLAHRIGLLEDQFGLRRPDLLDARLGRAQDHLVSGTRLTIGLVTADAFSPKAQTCIDALRRHTTRFELNILDGRNLHLLDLPKEYASLLENARSPYLVVMHDDVLVEEGWFENLLKELTDEVAAVMPTQVAPSRHVINAGLSLGPDGLTVDHVIRLGSGPYRIQAPDCALILLDVKKCKPLGFNGYYKRFFFDLDFGLRLWEAGYQVVSTPSVIVTRVDSGKSMSAELKELLIEHDSMVFNSEWGNNTRLRQIRESAWRSIPEIDQALEVAFSPEFFLKPRETESLEAYEERISDGIEAVSAIPMFIEQFRKDLGGYLQLEGRNVPSRVRGFLYRLSESYRAIDLVEPGVYGHHVFMSDARYVALPEEEGMLERQKLVDGKYPKALVDFRLDRLMARLKALAG